MGKLHHVFLKKTVLNNETKQPEIVEEEFVICDVCGHANPVTSHECEQCSNFLEDVSEN